MVDDQDQAEAIEPPHIHDPALVHTIVQITDAAEHEVPPFLKLWAKDVAPMVARILRGWIDDQRAGLQAFREQMEAQGASGGTGISDAIEKRLSAIEQQNASISEQLDALNERFGALDKGTDKRLDAHDRALKALKAKPAPTAPAPETGAAERTDQGGAPSPAS